MAEPRDDDVRARYRALATEEPSAALDDAIRAAARRAVASAPGGAKRSRAQRWAVPASLAAVLFLSFGVVMRMEQEVPPLEIESGRTAAPGADSYSRKEAAPAMQPEPAPKTQAPQPGLAKDAAAPAASSQAVTAPLEKRRLPPPPAKPAPAAPVPQPTPGPLEFVPRPAAPPAAAMAPADAPVASPPPPAVARVPLPPPMPAPAPAPQSAVSPMTVERAAAAPSASVTLAKPEPRAFSDAPAAQRAPMEEHNVAPGRRDEAAGASGLAAQQRAKAMAAPPQRSADSLGALSAPWPDTPEKKLERIETLRKAGRDREADEGIARFRREHPAYVIPEATWERIRPR